MRIACVWADHFPFRLEAERDPELAKCDVILYECSGSRKEVVDASLALTNVLPGMLLNEAQSRCKDAILVETDPGVYERTYGQILHNLSKWSPEVERGWLGCAYVGLDGLETTHGTEDQLIDGLLGSLPRYLKPCIGISTGKFPAYIASLSAEPGKAFKTPMDLRGFLAPFSVDILPVPWEIKSRLHIFGLHTLGQLIALDIGHLQAQFGRIGGKIWNLAQGIDNTPLQPLRHKEEIAETISFAAPVFDIKPLLMAIEVLLGRLFNRPELRNKYVRSAIVEIQMINRSLWRQHVIFKPGTGDKAKAYQAIKGHMDNLALHGLVETVRLTFRNLMAETGKQESLLRGIRKQSMLREAILALKIAQGQNPIYKIKEIEPWSRIPERRVALVPYEP
ncbi:hypothetical protein M1N24_00085 [Dehalococcoidia bacterium]|nr:hypothetical protein [Dehalococcoidia bacterium]